MHRIINTIKDREKCIKRRVELGKTRIRLGISVLFLFGLLCGCTRKEELLLMAQTTSHDATILSEKSGENQEDTGERSESAASGQAAGYIEAEQQTGGKIYVHVCGAVKVPGVYALEADSRVYEAVMAAGGFTEQADESYVNQAQKVSDGVRLLIPTKEEVEQGSVESPESGITGGMQTTAVEEEATQEKRININTASEAQLCEIPGIGATRAAAIAAYRQEHGRFNRIEDIMNVNGIKEGTFEKIKETIRVD